MILLAPLCFFIYFHYLFVYLFYLNSAALIASRTPPGYWRPMGDWGFTYMDGFQMRDFAKIKLEEDSKMIKVYPPLILLPRNPLFFSLLPLPPPLPASNSRRDREYTLFPTCSLSLSPPLLPLCILGSKGATLLWDGERQTNNGGSNHKCKECRSGSGHKFL